MDMVLVYMGTDNKSVIAFCQFQSKLPPNLVRLEYFDGTSWTNIATGIPAKSGSYVWDTTGFPDSFSALWRVVDEGGSGVSDVTDNPFALRNQPHDFFVNDAFTNGDIYCSAAGSAANSGLSASTTSALNSALCR